MDKDYEQALAWVSVVATTRGEDGGVKEMISKISKDMTSTEISEARKL